MRNQIRSDLRLDPLVHRRAAVAGVAAAVGALVLPAPTAHALGGLSLRQRSMVLDVARAGAVFPVPFPAYGERGRAVDRATSTRLRRTYALLSPRNASVAHAGIQRLLDAGLGKASTVDLIVALGRFEHSWNPKPREALAAAVSLAVGTVSTHFDPNSRAAAKLWLAGLARLHESGHLRRLATEGLT